MTHIFTLAWGQYNHANFSIDKRYTGALVLGLFTALVITTTSGIDLDPMTTGLIIVGSLIPGFFLLGPAMKYLFNSPEMHIWHHVHDLPDGYPNGINFGITLALWDYLFGTALIPHSGRDIELGFPKDEEFPDGFLGQMKHGILKDS